MMSFQWDELAFFCLMICLLTACHTANESEVDLSPEESFKAYCTSCHATTRPTLAPKKVWQESLLPRMGIYLGMGFEGTGIGMEERSELLLSGTVTMQAALDTSQWGALKNYVIGLAPVAIPVDTQRVALNEPLVQFRPHPISLGKESPFLVTALNWEEGGKNLRLGTYGGDAYLRSGERLSRQERPSLQHAISRQVTKGEIQYVLEVGEFTPSETDYGVLHRYGPGQQADTLATGLHRAVDLQVADLNGDGKDEFIICEYGNLRGQLSLLTGDTPGKYQTRSLLSVPGTIRTQVRDLNGDDRPDIVVLAAQGNEGVYILYQEDGLSFRSKQVIRLPPIYGSSWFELIDYEGDGDQDIVLVNGDNADYSNFLKPYHGLRLYLNDGNNAFAEVLHLPIYGATRVIANDFDEDGDYDFAVTAYFPDWNHNPTASFLYLENTDRDNYQFRYQTTPAATDGRWLVHEQGDFDGDGDTDLILGNFPLYPGRQYHEVAMRWQETNTELLWLENLQR